MRAEDDCMFEKSARRVVQTGVSMSLFKGGGGLVVLSQKKIAPKRKGNQ